MFPEDLKLVNVTPVYKKKSKNSKDNLGSMSILPIETTSMNFFAKITNDYNGEFKTLSNTWNRAFPASSYRLQRQIKNFVKHLRWCVSSK